MTEKNHNIKKQKLIKDNAHLFWYVDKNSLSKISDESLVESILNFGDWKSVQKLIEVLSIEKVSEIFFKQIERKRVNYRVPTMNFFKIYFNEHLQKRNINRKSTKAVARNQKV